MQDLLNNIQPIFKNLYVQIALLIVFATAHGYAGAWLAVRMLFRPRNPVRVLGITVFPQGMIPRHRDRLANAIGKAVGDELVSHDTIIEQNYPSIIETLPKNVREPILDAISGLQLRLSEHITAILKSSESTAAISSFVTRRVDDVLSKRVSEVIDDEAFSKITSFLEQRIRSAVEAPSFENKIREFIGRRINDLAGSETPLGELFTQDAVALLKEKANEQVEPAIRQLTELAASERTRNQIGALIKKEVHEYYENLPFYKKIFVSRENLLHEVDSLVNESLPRRIEETLRGEFFADEARNFIGSSIDNALAKPLPVAIGAIAPEQLDRLKEQVAVPCLALYAATK